MWPVKMNEMKSALVLLLQILKCLAKEDIFLLPEHELELGCDSSEGGCIYRDEFGKECDVDTDKTNGTKCNLIFTDSTLVCDGGDEPKCSLKFDQTSRFAVYGKEDDRGTYAK